AGAAEIQERLERCGLDGGKRETGNGNGGSVVLHVSRFPFPLSREVRDPFHYGEFPLANRASECPRPHHPPEHFARGHHEIPLLVPLRATEHLITRYPSSCRSGQRSISVSSMCTRAELHPRDAVRLDADATRHPPAA